MPKFEPVKTLLYTIEDPFEVHTIPLHETIVQSNNPSADTSEVKTKFAGWKSLNFGEGTSTDNTINVPGQTVQSGSQAALEFANSMIGLSYMWGGKNADAGGVDCSGLAYWAYKKAGIEVPKSTSEWINSGRDKIDKFEGLPGDVFISYSKSSKSARHLRIITKNLGNGKYEYIAAENSKKGVTRGVCSADDNLIGIYRAKNGLKLVNREHLRIIQSCRKGKFCK